MEDGYRRFRVEHEHEAPTRESERVIPNQPASEVIRMSGLAPSGENLLLDTLLTGRFVSLHVGDPGDAGASEVIGGAYARQSATFTKTGSNPTVAANSAVIQFPTATADWGHITFFGLWSAVSAGTFLGGWPVLVPKAVGPDDTARWEVGKLKIGTDEPLP